MCYVLPAIIHRFESYLIALDACKVLDLKVSPALALEALTKDSDNSEEHGEDKINFKSGMGPNYERLEFRTYYQLLLIFIFAHCHCPSRIFITGVTRSPCILTLRIHTDLVTPLLVGDCFLKMATSLSVFVQQPDENEFQFHVRRMEMLCNKNLMETAIGKKKVPNADGTERDLQLYSYIRTDSFSRYVYEPNLGAQANAD
jgi:endoribonuclease Dicer